MNAIETLPLTGASINLLTTVFGEDWLDAWVCSKSDMHGKRVRDLQPDDLLSNDDCYFSIAFIQAGARSRSVDTTFAVAAYVFDDVGTKIDKEAFDMFCPLEPTWEIETSPGNWQYGFAIDGWATVEEYRALRAAMATHPIWGKSDAAMDPVHLYRLPQGTNTKNGWVVS